MKAKKIIAIGLVAAMTLGMSTSVFATETVDPKDVPQFNGWGDDYLPTDNVFHANGQGWLESGVGINETVTNVIVPTMPNLNYKYGDPGPYDFGFDPQRLVDRTSAKKYAKKMNFTKQAKESGVYFLNGYREPGSEEEQEYWKQGLNTFDNKSIKLVGTNIGTEPVAFTVTARTKEGKNFTYLEDKPVAVTTAKDAFNELYDQVGATWENYVETRRDTEGNPDPDGDPLREETNKFVFARDLVTENLDYNITEAVGGANELSAAIRPFLNLQFVKSGETESKYSRAVLEDEVANTTDGSESTFLNNLAAYQLAGSGTTVDSSAVGMYLGLNTALGTQESSDEEYEAAANSAAILPANVEEENKDKFNAEATATERVEGTPENYDWDYSSSGEYGKFIIEDPDPFRTVAFWFDGVATKNNEVVMYDETTHPEGVKIPKFEFTWTFSKGDSVPKPPAPPVPVGPAALLTIDGGAVPTTFNNVFPGDNYGSNGMVLGFNKEVKGILFSKNGTTWMTYDKPAAYFEIGADDATLLTVTTGVFKDCNNSQSNRFWRVDFGEEEYLDFTFTPSSV